MAYYEVGKYSDASGEIDRLGQQSELLSSGELQAFARLGLPDAGTVLDLGCGPGQFAARLKRTHPGLSIVGVDIDDVCLQKARRIVSSVKADLRALPIREACLDFAYSRLALRHVAHPETALKAIYAALKPGARLLIEEADNGAQLVFPEPPHFRHVYEARLEAMLRSGGDPYIGRKLLKLLRRTGFEAIQVVNVSLCSMDVGRERFADVVLGAFATPLSADIIDRKHLDELRSGIEAWKSNDDAFGLTTVIMISGRKPA